MQLGRKIQLSDSIMVLGFAVSRSKQKSSCDDVINCFLRNLTFPTTSSQKDDTNELNHSSSAVRPWFAAGNAHPQWHGLDEEAKSSCFCSARPF